MYTPKKAYFYGTGRRKSSIARVRLIPGGTGVITVNGRTLDNYFGMETLKYIVRQPIEAVGVAGKFERQYVHSVRKGYFRVLFLPGVRTIFNGTVIIRSYRIISRPATPL